MAFQLSSSSFIILNHLGYPNGIKNACSCSCLNVKTKKRGTTLISNKSIFFVVDSGISKSPIGFAKVVKIEELRLKNSRMSADLILFGD